MKSVPRGVWHYVILLFCLFILAAAGAWTIIDYLLDNIRTVEHQTTVHAATIAIFALTTAFLLSSGALGLWAIQFSVETESQERVSRLVESMSNLSDGLLVADKKGRIQASNPAIKAMISSGVARRMPLRDAFPCLSGEDVELLLALDGPNEVQRDQFRDNERQTLRFRSQVGTGIRLILVSDVTTVRVREMRKQQIARLELIGRIVRGAANDFNNLLVGIAGHAALISRLEQGSAEMATSIEAIGREAERGAMLAGHLLDFSRLGVSGKPTEEVGEHVKKASNLIRMGLSSAWRVEATVDDHFSLVPLSGLQVEQIVLNLGVVAADALPRPGIVRITARRPNQDHLFDVGNEYAAVVIVSSSMPGTTVGDEKKLDERDATSIVSDTGVVQSVVRSVVEDAGGSLEFWLGSDESQLYRLLLPFGSPDVSEEGEDLPDELKSYISQWQVLLARSTRDHDYVEEQLAAIGVSVDRVDNVITALARVEDGHTLHAIIVDKKLLGDEAYGLLKAILKLCPGTGIVVLCEDPDSEPSSLMGEIVFESRRTSPGKVIRAMIEAKGMAGQRKAQ
jgi:signal transduction histidine kinase